MRFVKYFLLYCAPWLRSFPKRLSKRRYYAHPLTFTRDVWYCFDVPIKQALIKSPRLDIVAHINRDGVFRCVQDRHWDFYPGVVALFLCCRIYSSTPREGKVVPYTIPVQVR